MLDALFAGLEATALARTLRDSVWAYPLVNAAHILGVALLVGSIVTLDLRLLGVWRSVPLAPLWQVSTPMAAAGLSVAIVFGLLLFITRATEYVASALFVSKLLIVVLGCANALALRAIAPEMRSPSHATTAPVRARIRAMACLSLAAWITALVLGRLVGYF